MENLNWFKKITEDNQNFIDGERRARFHITDHHQDLYIEPLHFIFELLQNADDQNAKKTTFIFSDNDIKFFHDGNQFNQEDVRGICAYAYGLKREDNQKIGKFGLGFKSVLQFTDEPKIFAHINDRPINFIIKDKCVPHMMDDINPKMIDEVNRFGGTGFLFELKEKGKEIINNYLDDFIDKYSSKILLYLQNLQKIIIQNRTNQIIINKKKRGNYFIDLIYETNNKKNIKKYFIFTFNINKKLEHFGSNIPPIKISFQLKGNKFIKSNETSTLQVFLPTKEETGLYFDIQAPFKLDTGRALINFSIENEDFNKALLSECALAVYESIIKLKDLNLLNSSFYELMPLEGDFKAENFDIIRESIQKCLNEEKIWTTYNNEYEYIKNLIYGEKSSKKIFGLEEIRILYENEDVNWLSDIGERGKGLAIKFGIRNFFEESNYLLNKYFRRYEYVNFLTPKNNNWLIDFYLWMNENYSDNDLPLLQIIKTSSKLHPKVSPQAKGNRTVFERGFEVRIPSKTRIKFKKFEYIDPFFISLTNIKRKNISKLKFFLKRCGVSEVNEKDEIINILEEFYNKKDQLTKINISNKEYLIHFKRFIRYFNKSKDKKIFQKYNFFINNNKQRLPLILSNLSNTNYPFIDEDNIEYKTYLSHIYSDFYKIYIPNEIKKKFIAFAKALGVIDRIKIYEEEFVGRYSFSPYGHPNREEALERQGGSYNIIADYIDVDYLIDSNIFKNLTIEKSFAICKTLNKIPRSHFKAIYRKTQKQNPSSYPSSLIFKLREQRWIPDINKKFFKPSDLNKNTINKIFIKMASSHWLKLVDFEQGESINQTIVESSKKIGVKKSLLRKQTDLSYDDQELVEKFVDELINKRSEITNNESSSNITTKHGMPTIDPTAEKPDRKNLFNKKDISQKNTSHIKSKKLSKKQTRKNIHNLDLKKLYANHCQICLAQKEINELVPKYSYAEKSYNRQYIMQMHHVIHKSDGGKDHAGNLISLCRFHHNEYGDIITSSSITEALNDSSKNVDLFDEGEVTGTITKMNIVGHNNYIKIYFDNLHKNYWLNNK